jgi:hypothetical protein
MAITTNGGTTDAADKLEGVVPIVSSAVLDCCPDWPVQIEKVNGPIVLQSLRAGRDLYDGIPFRYCPWCGRKRPDKKSSPTQSSGTPHARRPTLKAASNRRFLQRFVGQQN